MAGLTVVTAPSSTPITLPEAKTFLRIDTNDDDALINTLIGAARDYFEEYTGRTTIQTTFKLSLDGFNEDGVPIQEGFYTAPYMTFHKRYIALPRPPLVSVTHLKTFDEDNTETTFASSKYHIDSARNPARIVLKEGETWPTDLRVANGIEITYVAGYGSSASDVPNAIKVGMREHVTYLYEHRGDYEQGLNTFPMLAKQLYQPYRVLSFSKDAFSNAGGY
ncbi:MAG TPA: hypothetical protein DCM40_13865 [Maribacter sp.]|jgi:hypothetical protein|nr:hypothetical protein [Maribacter sp.]|tara:strand:+ start:314 stop:976 length:663 start_codon:yes stop_codon:yes gene_type:complete